MYKTSGHYPYYKDSQFPPIEVGEDERYLLRPMNCPHHITIYKSKPRSYRDLPLRLAEFGTVHRFEQSGELNGMTRVRGFTQDDAHIFCTEEQVAAEFRGCLDMTQFVLKTLGLNDYRVRLGFRDPASDKYVGSAEKWQRAEEALERVCGEMNLPDLHVERGEAAFYGPKADFIVADCIGRQWQLGTVQLDYNLPSPQRFGLEYIGDDNAPHQPVMIHRAPFGSFERFVGMLIEHFAGAFPLWLAPEQVRVMVVSQKAEEYGRGVERQLAEAGFRVSGDYRAEKIGAKIRDAQLELIPYMFVIGGREAEEGKVAVRDRIEGDLGAMPLAAAIERLRAEVASEDGEERRRNSGVSGQWSVVGTVWLRHCIWIRRVSFSIDILPLATSPLSTNHYPLSTEVHCLWENGGRRRVTGKQRINEQIRITPVRVIGADGTQLGILATDEALRQARAAGARSGRGGARRASARLPDHGLRQVQVPAEEAAAQGPRPSGQDQGDPRPPEDRRQRHPGEGEQGPRVPGREGQGDRHGGVSRPRVGPHRRRPQGDRRGPGATGRRLEDRIAAGPPRPPDDLHAGAEISSPVTCPLASPSCAVPPEAERPSGC